MQLRPAPHTAQSGTDWLDYCASVLIVDLDNDGDLDIFEIVGDHGSNIWLNDGNSLFTRHDLDLDEINFSE